MAEVTLQDEDKIKRIYFVGIKGVGMAALAEIACDAGFVVRGSDIAEEFLTDSVLSKKGIQIDEGFEESSIIEFIDNSPEEVLVITTAAHDGLSNPQCVAAASLGVQILTHGQAVGYFMTGTLFKRAFEGISVLGCHGKTTVTAMAATALFIAGLDPTYAIGTSESFPLGPAGYLGGGKYFVAEADEFISDVQKDRTVKFLYQFPQFAIVNNIDFDHPDVYKDLEAVKKTFEKFCLENIKKDGTLFINGDDPSCMEIEEKVLSTRTDISIVTYGEGERNITRIVDFQEQGWGSSFSVTKNGKMYGAFKLSVPGYHNAKNVLAVIALLDMIGIGIQEIQKAVVSFQGTKRRQEKVGVTQKGAVVIDDYAHHPEEIEKTLLAVKKAFPDKKIVCLFQPHTISRTESLQGEFAKAFTSADSVVFLPIFTSKREGEMNYDQLYASIKKMMQEAGTEAIFMDDTRQSEELQYSPYFFLKNRTSVIEYLKAHFNSSEFVLVFLGAGDLYKLAYDMVE